jgi:membrane-bound metal-dependent hydrolase YbcI (DUF457 family)
MPLAWLFHLLTRRNGSFVAATLGSVVPDLEVPFYFVNAGFRGEYARGVMHSLLGASTVNVAVVWLLARYAVPRLWRWAVERWPSPQVFKFAGDDVRSGVSPLAFYLSAVAGGLSHLWLDLLTHSYNPLLWPYTAQRLEFLPFASWPPWEVAFNLLWLGVLAALLRRHWGVFRA